MRISDWRSDVCSSDLIGSVGAVRARRTRFVMLTVALAAVPVTAPVAAMLPPGAPPAPITQIAAAERMAVAIIVVHPHPVTGIIIIVVPASAESDADRKSTRLNSSH